MNTQIHTYRKQRSGALHLTQKVDYGLMLLICLAKTKNSESVSIKTIAEEKNLSFSFLQKIARTFQKAEILEAERGKYGGYRLKKDPKKITLKDIIETLEGPIALIPCLGKHIDKPRCYNKKQKCEVQSGLQKINDEVENFFASKTLHQIVS